MRLRQAVLAASDLEGTKKLLESHGLRDPFRDPGVKEFGLDNAVYPVGDTFLEVVSPVQDDTTAGRYLDRVGADPVGYMVIVQVDDLDDIRSRAERLRIRTVWSIDLEDIRASHLHPKDTGAITSIDQPTDPASWRWGGPGWEDRAVPGRVRAVTMGADAELWSGLLNRRVVDGVMALDDGSELRFARASDAGQGVDGQGVMSIEVEVDGTTVTLP